MTQDGAMPQDIVDVVYQRLDHMVRDLIQGMWPEGYFRVTKMEASVIVDRAPENGLPPGAKGYQGQVIMSINIPEKSLDGEIRWNGSVLGFHSEHLEREFRWIERVLRCDFGQWTLP